MKLEEFSRVSSVKREKRSKEEMLDSPSFRSAAVRRAAAANSRGDARQLLRVPQSAPRSGAEETKT